MLLTWAAHSSPLRLAFHNDLEIFDVIEGNKSYLNKTFMSFALHDIFAGVSRNVSTYYVTVMDL